jgi:FixJ family two-component response regulator
MAISQQTPVRIFLVDDEPAVTRSLKWLLATVGIDAVVCGGGGEFLTDLAAHEGPACAVLDLRMPGMTGLEIIETLVAQRRLIPVVMLTAHGDVESAVRAMKLGALDFLQKPFAPEIFVEVVRRAVERAREHHACALAERGRSALLDRLSARERELLPLLLDGASSKEIARRLELSPRTVDVHRASILGKAGAASMRELTARLRARPTAGHAPDTSVGSASEADAGHAPPR